MKTTRKIVLAFVLLTMAFVAGTARADWNPGDGYKMHFPQLPDADGLDVDFEDPHLLADDWLCTGTGAVSGIHFWVSHKEGEIPILWDLHVEIYSNVP